MPEDAGSIYSSLFLKLDNLEKGVIKVESLMNKVVKTTKGKASGFSSFWANAFQTAFGLGIVQLINKVTSAIRDAVAIFSGFQQSMRNVQSVTGATGEEFRLMTEKAKEAGETTRFTAREAADALYYLGSAGFTAQQSISALDGVLQLAGATQSDLASTSETVASIISQYNLQAEDATRISNTFAAAIGNSQATMEKLANSFRQVGPVAAGFGYSVEETVGALQELYNAGFQGQMAGRALKSALADLASPTANIEKIMSKYNISLDKVNPATNELADIIDILGKSGMTTADIIDAFGKVAGPQMAVLIREGGDALRKYTDDVTNTNAAAEAYKIQNDSLAGSLDFLKSKLESTAIAIFEKLEPGMRDLIDSFISFLDASRPLGEALGFILNILLQMASISTNVITGIFQGIFSQFEKSKTPLQEASENFEKVRESIRRAGELGSTINRLNDLNSEYEKLSTKSKLSKEEQDKLKKIIKDITDIVPDAATAFDEYGNAIALSTEKTKESARQLLETKKAVLLEAKTRLEIQKPILEGILRRDKAEADAAKRSRENLAREGNVAERRLALIETFNLKYNSLVKAGMEPVSAFLQVNEELADQLEYVGITLETSGGKARILGQGFKELEKQERDSEKALNRLLKALETESEIEIRVKDAEKSLNELENLQNEIKAVDAGLKELGKTAETTAGMEKVTDFWTEFRKQMEEATREARLFGDEQDVLKEKLDFLKNTYLDLIDKGMNPESETLQRLKQEYDLIAIVLDSLIEKEKDHTKTLSKKNDVEKDVIAMTEDYKNKLEDLGKTDKELIDAERERARAEIEAMGATEEATNNAIEAMDEYYDKLKEREAIEEFVENFNEIIEIAIQLAGVLAGIWSDMTDARLEELDRQYQAELEAAGLAEESERERLERERDEAIAAGNDELARERENDLKRLDIKEKYERKKAMIEYEGEMVAWRFKLAGAIADLAVAIAKALASAPWPLNLPAIGYATVTGGIQVAAVTAQKPRPPKFETGGIYTGPATPGVANAELHPDEMILTADQQAGLWNMLRNSGSTASMSSNITIILEMNDIEIARAVGSVMNNGIVRLKPDMALE